MSARSADRPTAVTPVGSRPQEKETDGDQAFSFVAGFTKVAGQATLTYVAGTNITTLRVDINGGWVL